jgi:hypothetical protein
MQITPKTTIVKHPEGLRFEVLMAVKRSVMVFWVLTLVR